MTKTPPLQVAAAVLSAFVTVGTFAGVNTMAAHEVVKAHAVVASAQSQLPQLAPQTVVIVARRIAKA